MKAEIIAVGTELLMGQVVNTNATDISKSLHAVNIPVFFQSVVGDNEQRIIDLLQQASQRSQLVILCGGLGPTEDDVTKQALSTFLNVPLYYDANTLDKIKQFFKKNNRVMTENNMRQSVMLEGGIPLPNDVGLAVGCATEQNGVHYIVLPGPPQELKAMLINRVEPLLKKLTHQIIYSKLLRFTNIGEAKLAEMIHDIIIEQTNPTIAIYANVGLVDVRISASAKTTTECLALIEPIEKIMLERLNEYFYGINHDTLNEKVISLLKQSNQTLSVAESFTGGMCQSFLIDTKGASQVLYGGYVTYNNTAKINQLGVPEHIINKYGVYSEQCALYMAKKVREKCGTTIGLSFTGLADNVVDNDHNNIFIGFSSLKGEYVIAMTIKRERNVTRQLAVYRACHELIKTLEVANGN